MMNEADTNKDGMIDFKEVRLAAASSPSPRIFDISLVYNSYGEADRSDTRNWREALIQVQLHS
jgi:hypothetical protein